MKERLFCNNRDRMSDLAFRMMSWIFRVKDFFSPLGPVLNSFGIRPGDVVVDFGCGPGRYIPQASQLAGAEGTVYAVDIQPLAVEAVDRLIREKSLKNVRTLFYDGNTVNLPDYSVDLIYALDMFHMVSKAGVFLDELARICKPGGILILEDGHQPRNRSREKLRQSAKWGLVEENERYMKLAPVDAGR